MVKKERNEAASLCEGWDTDASASDNESFDIEMMQDDSIKVPNTKKVNSTEEKQK